MTQQRQNWLLVFSSSSQVSLHGAAKFCYGYHRHSRKEAYPNVCILIYNCIKTTENWHGIQFLLQQKGWDGVHRVCYHRVILEFH